MVKDVQTNKQKSEIFCLIITDHTSWPCARWHLSLSQTICGRAQSRHCSVLGETKWSSTRSYPLRSYEVRKRKKLISKQPEKDRKGIVEKRFAFSGASSVSDLECSKECLQVAHFEILIEAQRKRRRTTFLERGQWKWLHDGDTKCTTLRVKFFCFCLDWKELHHLICSPLFILHWQTREHGRALLRQSQLKRAADRGSSDDLM